MTLEELVNLNIRDNYVTDGVHVYCIEVTFKITSNHIEFTFTDIKSGKINDLIVIKWRGKYILQNPMKNHFLHNLSIKPKKEESKMKTEFTMSPQTTKEITYPKFMLRKADGIIVLFFQKECGVVVCGNHHIEPKYFLSSWNMDFFTPVDGCSVTFSDKD